MIRRAFAAFTGAVVLAASIAAAEPFAKVPGPGVSISEVHEHAELYLDRATVEGEVVWRQGQDLFQIEDATGKMYLRIPWSLQQKNGTPAVGDDIRVRGHYTKAALHEKVRGIHCEGLQILESRP
jgi:uncharacterized protein YdeI (BOF family)